ncbi:ankyrin repeat domain-containing SOCS box protein [Rhodopirellula sp. SWK7]|nr:ankyrin repeat domain-containing SOCS box protein [Rhodopirellula sp. SWK7]
MRKVLSENPNELAARPAGLSWLDRAASSDGGDLRMVKLLVALGASVDPMDVIRTPLAYAIPSADVEIIRFLLEQGANPNADRCLIGALNRRQNSLEIVRLLIQKGAEVNRVYELEGTGKKFTALDWAKDSDAIAFLTSVGAVTADQVSPDSNKPEE